MGKCKTSEGEFRQMTSGDGRKDFDTDVLDELEESYDEMDAY